MLHNLPGLYEMLNTHLKDVNAQITAIIEDHQVQRDEWPAQLGDTSIYQAKLGNGSPILAEMFAAKANLLSAMANLKAAEMASKGKSRGSW